jgi:hypothetical protein
MTLFALYLGCTGAEPVTVTPALEHLAVGDCTDLSVATGERCTAEEQMERLVPLPGGAPSRCPAIPYDVVGEPVLAGGLRATPIDGGWNVCCDAEGSATFLSTVRTDGREHTVSARIACSAATAITPDAAPQGIEGCVGSYVRVALADGATYGADATVSPADGLNASNCATHGGDQVVHLEWNGLVAAVPLALPDDATLPVQVHVETTPGAMVTATLQLGVDPVIGADCAMTIDGGPAPMIDQGCSAEWQASDADLGGRRLCGRLRTRTVCGTLPPAPWALVGAQDFTP